MAGTSRRGSLPVSFGKLLTRDIIIPAKGGKGKVLWLCLSLSHLLSARSYEMFAADSGEVHSVHCLTRGGVVFYAEGTQLQHMRWRQADKVEACSKGDQEHMGSIRVDTDRGLLFEVVIYGGAVALMLDLMSCFSGLRDHAPLTSYRSGKSVEVVRYGRALRAIMELVAKSPVSLASTRCIPEERQRSRPGVKEKGDERPTHTEPIRVATSRIREGVTHSSHGKRTEGQTAGRGNSRR